MIRRAIEGLLCDSVERALNRTRFTEEQLQRIAAGIPADNPEAMKDCLRVERCVMIWAFEAAKHGATEDDLMGRPRRHWTKRLMERVKDGPFYTDEDYVLALRLSPARIKSFADPALAQQEMNDKGAEFNRLAKGRLSKLIGPNFSKAITSQFDIRAKMAAMKAAIDVERYRLSHDGALPTAPLPPDIVPGKLLQLKKLPRGFMVYSVGCDGVDHGGITRTNSSPQNSYDITFRVER